MKIRDVMFQEVITISPETTYEEAAKMIVERRHSGFPVVDKSGAIVGMLSEKNLFRGLYPTYEDFMTDPENYIFNQERREHKIQEIRMRPVSDFMSKEVVCVSPDDPILKAGGIMLAKHYYRLPVVEGGKLVGLVTRANIFSRILKEQLGL